jgi:hypothetical protein
VRKVHEMKEARIEHSPSIEGMGGSSTAVGCDGTAFDASWR